MDQPNPNPEPQYVVAWENRTPGRQGMKGKGTKRMPRREALSLAKELNRDYPTINHWAEPA